MDKVYWHSQINDGTQAVEEWPGYRLWLRYNDWYDQIEDKALGTLKVAVAQLLSEFDKEENKTYDGEDLTKRGQIETLLSLIEG